MSQITYHGATIKPASNITLNNYPHGAGPVSDIIHSDAAQSAGARWKEKANIRESPSKLGCYSCRPVLPYPTSSSCHDDLAYLIYYHRSLAMLERIQ